MVSLQPCRAQAQGQRISGAQAMGPRGWGRGAALGGLLRVWRPHPPGGAGLQLDTQVLCPSSFGSLARPT